MLGSKRSPFSRPLDGSGEWGRGELIRSDSALVPLTCVAVTGAAAPFPCSAERC